MTYVAPMRRAVIWLCSLGKPWDVCSLVNAADVERRRAAAYVTVLAKEKALAYDGDMVKVGTRFMAYVDAKVTTRPGGNASAYRDSARIRAAHYMEDVDARRIIGYHLREKRLKVHLTLQEAAGMAGVSFQHLSKVERGTEGLLPETHRRLEQVLDESLATMLRAAKEAT